MSVGPTQMPDIFGITPEPFAGTYEAFLEGIHSDDREVVQQAARKALDEDTPLGIA